MVGNANEFAATPEKIDSVTRSKHINEVAQSLADRLAALAAEGIPDFLLYAGLIKFETEASERFEKSNAVREWVMTPVGWALDAQADGRARE